MAGETQLSSVSVDQVAFDRLAYFALRSELLFDQAADVQPVQQASLELVSHSPSSQTSQQRHLR